MVEGADMSQRRRGFTLVELLVVITIIALLLAMLLPTFAQLDIIRKVTQCQKNLSDMHKALSAYATMNKGKYPYITDHYYGSKFIGDYVSGDRWAGLGHVKQLKQVGAKAETFYCPFDPVYGNWDRWPANTWLTPYHPSWDAEHVYVHVGYAMILWRSARLADGRYAPHDDSTDDDMPLAADRLHYRSSGTYTSGWYHGGGLPDGLFNSDCNTLFRGGQVVLTDANAFDWSRPALTIGSCVDYWWFALEP